MKLRNVLRKSMSLVLACSMMLSSVLVAKAESEGGVEFPITYSAGVTVAGTGSDYSNLANFYDNGGTFTVKEDGSVTLKYNVGTVSTGIISKTYYDSNEYYYKVNAEDEYQKANVTWGSTRVTAVEFEVDSTEVRNVYVKADVYKRGSSSITETIEGTATFDVTQAKAPVFNLTNQKFSDTTTVAITSEEIDNKIFYTINGVEKEYTEPFEISETTTISAYTVIESYIVSETTEVTYEKTSDINKELVSVKARNAGDYSKDSSYNELIEEDAYIITKEDGSKELVLSMIHGEMMGMDCYLENISYYSEDGKTVSTQVLQYFDEESYVYPGYRPALVVAVPIINESSNYIEMEARAGTNSWYTNYHDFTMEIISEEPEVEEPEVEEPEVEQPEVDEDNKDNTFLFGAAKVELLEGVYSVPATVMQAYKKTEISMADGALDGNVILYVDANGSAKIKVRFMDMDYYTLVGTVTKASYYKSDEINSNYLEEASVLLEDKNENPSLVMMDIADNSWEGIYVQFDVRDVEQNMDVHVGTDAYLVLDYDQAVECQQSGFGQSDIDFNTGNYSVPVAMKNAGNITADSMAADALGEMGEFSIKEDGTYEVTVNFQELNVSGIVGNATDIKYYTSKTVNSSSMVDAVIKTTDAQGYPRSVTFKVSNKDMDGLYINMNITGINMNQDAYIAIDYSNAKAGEDLPYEPEVEAPEEEPEVEAPEEEPEVETPEKEPEVEVPEIQIPSNFTTKNLKAVGVGSNGVQLTWGAVEGAKGYLVYAKKNNRYAYVGMTTQGTSYTDKNAIHDDYNYYWVFPYVQDSMGKMHAGECEAYTYATTACAAVTYLRASSVTGGVRLTWVAASGADGYLVYGRRAGGAYEYVGMTTQGVTYTDSLASKTDYNFYWVFAYHKDENGKMIVGATPTYTYGRAL